MVLVEGSDANGVTIDHQCDTLVTGTAADQVLAGIFGTRDSAAEGGHRIASIGVAWTDRAAAAELKGMLRANDIDEVVLVSQLHAASALAQAIGQALGCERTALMFLERDTATLAVVRAADGAVVRVESRSLHADDAVAGLQNMVAGLERLAQPPQAVFMVGSGIDVAALKPKIAAGTTLTVHAPEDGALALARGAALAAANAPRFEAETVGVTPGTDVPTVAGIITQRAPAGYMAPLGYSAMPDDDPAGDDPAGDDPADDDPADDDPVESAETDPEPFMLVGSALMTIFVVGVLALLASIIITIRPAAEQRTDPGENAAVLSTSLPNTQVVETIANPVPVVQEAPRTILVTPRASAPVAPAPAVLPEPVLVPAAAPVVPAPVAPAPVVVPIAPQLVPQLLPQIVPQIVVPPARSTSTPASTTTSTTTATATSTTTSTATSTTTATATSTVASTPSASPSATTAQTSTPGESISSTVESPASSPTTASVVVTTPLVPSGPAA